MSRIKRMRFKWVAVPSYGGMGRFTEGLKARGIAEAERQRLEGNRESNGLRGNAFIFRFSDNRPRQHLGLKRHWRVHDWRAASSSSINKQI